jgi:hypothetical protein
VRRVQDGFRVTPLAAWGRPANATAPAPPAAPPLERGTGAPPSRAPPKQQIDDMPPEQFWPLAVSVLARTSAHAADWNQLARLRRLGIVQGRPLDWATAPPAMRAALAEGMRRGMERMVAKAFMLAPILNGWQARVCVWGAGSRQPGGLRAQARARTRRLSGARYSLAQGRPAKPCPNLPAPLPPTPGTPDDDRGRGVLRD